MSVLPLKGVKVLDFTRLLPGPFASMLLADMGADVLKVEDTRGGDYARHYPPMVEGVGAFFASVNRNKRSMTLDLKAEGAAELALNLIRQSDVLLESFRPGVMERLGIGPEQAKAVNPGLIYVSITGYGQTGPFRALAGHDLGYMAHSGLLGQNGAESGPQVPGFQLADLAGGALYAALGVTTALYAREKHGAGATLDISMTEGALSFAIPMLATAQAGGEVRAGKGMLTGGIASYKVYETLDGRHLAVGALEPKFWAGFVAAIGAPELVGSGHGTDPAESEAIQAILKTRTFDAWRAVFADLDVCVEPVLTPQETLESELHRTRKIFFQLAGVQHVRTPLTPAERVHQAAPGHGEHTDEVLEELGLDHEAIERLRAQGVV